MMARATVRIECGVKLKLLEEGEWRKVDEKKVCKVGPAGRMDWSDAPRHPTATHLAHCHTPCPLPHSLPTATQLANGIQLANCHTDCQIPHKLSTATQLAHSHIACSLPHSLPTVAQTAKYHTDCQLPHSLFTPT